LKFISPFIASTISGVLGFLGMTILHSLYYAALFGVFCWLVSRRREFIISLPFIWAAIEYLRSLSQFAFPWTNLSYTQWDYLSLIQTADLWGDIGLSFWIAVINLLIYLAWSQRRRIAMAIIPAIGVVLLFAGAFLYNSGPREYSTNLKIALLQGNFPLKVKWNKAMRDYNFEVYDSLTRVAHGEGADLIIWPETAAPMYLNQEPYYYSWLTRLAIELPTYMLVGTLTTKVDDAGNLRAFNSAIQFTPMGQSQITYSKIELVPFSERVPYADYFPPIKKIDLGQSDFLAGDTLLVFQHPKGNYACLICFELAFSDLVRQFANRGAEFFVTITNDTWFGRTAGPYQHMQMASFRAVENRTWIGRAANSGFSFTVDPYGTKYGRSNLEERTIVYGDIGKIKKKTFYTIHGMWLPRICLAATFLFLLAGLLVKLIRY
jgi:apolipoprotein N-acyltransferase